MTARKKKPVARPIFWRVLIAVSLLGNACLSWLALHQQQTMYTQQEAQSAVTAAMKFVVERHCPNTPIPKGTST